MSRDGRPTDPARDLVLHVRARGTHRPVTVLDARLTGVDHEITRDGGFVGEAALPPLLDRPFELLREPPLRPVLEVLAALAENRDEELEHAVVVRLTLVALHELEESRDLGLDEEAFAFVREDDRGRSTGAVARGSLADDGVRRDERLDRRKLELRPDLAHEAVLDLERLRRPTIGRAVVRGTTLVHVELDRGRARCAGDDGRVQVCAERAHHHPRENRVLVFLHPIDLFGRHARLVEAAEKRDTLAQLTREQLRHVATPSFLHTEIFRDAPRYICQASIA